MKLIKPRIGISACLLGQKVRYNGDDKRDDWLADELAGFVHWVPICPEVEMGLGVPRETIRLQGTLASPSLIGNDSGKDLTASARETASRILARKLDLDGYIFKKNSPSCGVERVSVYNAKGIPIRKGRGIFAARLIEADPRLPVIEEGRLTDPSQRERFVMQVFAWARLRRLAENVAELQAFHRAHKFLLLAWAPSLYPRLGKVAANSGKLPARDLIEEYRELFAAAIRMDERVGNTVNALLHMAGFLREHLSAEERKELHDSIHDYKAGRKPLLVSLQLIRFLAKTHKVAYLAEQVLLDPYPRELRMSPP